MTVLTKPNFVKMPPDILKYPLVEHNTYSEEKVEIDGVAIQQALRVKKCITYVKWLKVFLLLVLTCLVGCGVGLLENYMEAPRSPKYQGFCAVPVDNLSELRKLQFRAISPISEKLTDHVTERVMIDTQDTDDDNADDNDVQVISTVDDQAKSDALVYYLSEQLDIEDDIEKIYVTGALGKVNFVHDWQNNVSGIVEIERCFVMPIDPAVVLPPPAFVMAIEQGGPFQVSRAHSSVSVTLPPLQDLSHLPPYLRQHCVGRPIYQLRQVDSHMRKRAVDEEKPHYMHFSGKHIHEIRVENMAELLKYERGLAQ